MIKRLQKIIDLVEANNIGEAEKLIYEWVKTGVVDLYEFRGLLDRVYASYHQDGVKQGAEIAADAVSYVK